MTNECEGQLTGKLKENWKLVLKHYGPNEQMKKTREELMELDDVLENWRTTEIFTFREKVLEEGADVLNMLAQVFTSLDISSVEVLSMMGAKMDRAVKRITVGNGKINE
jgi:alkylhydroperoxidase family enzyme